MSHHEDLDPSSFSQPHRPIFKRTIIVPTPIAAVYGLALVYGILLIVTLSWVMADLSLGVLCVIALFTIVVHCGRQQALGRLENGADLIGMVFATWQDECGYLWLRVRTVTIRRLLVCTPMIACSIAASIAHSHII